MALRDLPKDDKFAITAFREMANQYDVRPKRIPHVVMSSMVLVIKEQVLDWNKGDEMSEDDCMEICSQLAGFIAGTKEYIAVGEDVEPLAVLLLCDAYERRLNEKR